MPTSAWDHTGFRRWVSSPDFPEEGYLMAPGNVCSVLQMQFVLERATRRIGSYWHRLRG